MRTSMTRIRAHEGSCRRLCLAGLLALATIAACCPSAFAGGPGGAPRSGAVIVFGATAGEVAGFCTRGPAVGQAYSVSVYASGRIAAVRVARSYPIPHLTSADVHHLVQRARRDHFFSIPAFIRDTKCAAAATTFIRIRLGSKAHT